MARRKKPAGQINNNSPLENLTKIMQEMGKKYSIKVGIVGEQARQTVQGTNLNYADLGAVHEFGATIKVTPKMRGWFWYNHKINKSNKPIEIPARSFLREGLLSAKGKKYLKEVLAENLPEDNELTELLLEDDPQFMRKIAGALAEAGELAVLNAFATSGHGTWKDITEFTKENRTVSPNNPPLNDTGNLLKNAIHSQIKEV